VSRCVQILRFAQDDTGDRDAGCHRKDASRWSTCSAARLERARLDYSRSTSATLLQTRRLRRAFHLPKMYHRGMASAIDGCPIQALIRLEGVWHSPLEADTLCGACHRGSTSRQESAHGEVYRLGRACVKLHARGDWPQRQATGVARGGDQRKGADRCGPKDAFGLAEALRTGALKRQVYKERGPFGTLGSPREGAPAPGERCRSGDDAAQESAALPRRAGVREDGVRADRARRLGDSAAAGRPPHGGAVVLGARRIDRVAGAGGAGDAHRGPHAPRVPDRDQLPRAGTDPHRGIVAHRRDAVRRPR
jgi:hypothetical protein